MERLEKGQQNIGEYLGTLPKSRKRSASPSRFNDLPEPPGKRERLENLDADSLGTDEAQTSWICPECLQAIHAQRTDDKEMEQVSLNLRRQEHEDYHLAFRMSQAENTRQAMHSRPAEGQKFKRKKAGIEAFFKPR